jgi:hypothetical protein
VGQGNASQNARLSPLAPGRYPHHRKSDPEGTGELAPILDLLGEVRPLGVILFARNTCRRAVACSASTRPCWEFDPEPAAGHRP